MNGNGDSFEPKIAAFVCNWGAYAAAEAASINHYAYPASISLLRLPCLGNLGVSSILDAFRFGADGVILMPCAPRHCHFETGNQRGETAMRQAQQLLKLAGVAEERLRIAWIPTGDGATFAHELCRFAEALRDENVGEAAPVSESLLRNAEQV